MTVQLPKDRCLKILNKLRTAKKRIYKKKTNFNWNAFRYKDTIPQSISLPQTPFYNSSYLCQRGRMGHMDSMAWPHRTLAELQWWSKTIKENNPHSILKSLPPQVVITTDAAPEAWEATLQVVKNNKFFNPEEEVKKLTLIEIPQSTIIEDGRVFFPTNINNSKWSYRDQLGLKERQKLLKEYQIVQQKWNWKMKNQTSNLKELTAIHLALEHFLPQIKKAHFTSILIRTDNTSAMYGINRKTGSQNFYMTTRKIWYLIDQNGMALKAVHIQGKLNTMMDKLSRLEMCGDYSLPRKTFQFIQETLRCYPNVDMFASKKSRLSKKYALVILTKDPNNVGNTLRIDWRKFIYPVLLHPPIPLILKTIQ
jgi:ribonuclease HI